MKYSGACLRIRRQSLEAVSLAEDVSIPRTEEHQGAVGEEECAGQEDPNEMASRVFDKTLHAASKAIENYNAHSRVPADKGQKKHGEAEA